MKRAAAVLPWLAATLGAVQAWVHRHYMDPDGVSYLDIAERVSSGDWGALVNAYWPPAFPAALAAALRWVRPPPASEASLAHAVQLLFFGLNVAAFAWVVRELRDWRRRRFGADEAHEAALAVWAWTLFIWTSGGVFSLLGHLTPDLAGNAAVFAVSALLLRVAGGRGGPAAFAAVGALAGIGALVKAALFPMAFVFVAAAFWAAREVPLVRRACLALAALAIFAAVVGPFVVALSRRQGRWTHGDSAKLHHAWLVRGARYAAHWQGGPDPDMGTPLHPTRRVSERPTVFEFGSPIEATYAPWYDPSYWHQGLRAAFRLDRQLSRSAQVLYDMGVIAVQSQAAVVAAALAVLAACATGWPSAVGAMAPWLLPPLANIASYVPVLVYPRYVTGAIALVGAGLFAAVRLPREAWASRLRTASVAAVAALLVWPAAFRPSRIALSQLRYGAPNTSWDVARALGERGLRGGDAIATLTTRPEPWIYWARLAKLRIVAELDPADTPEFWADPSTEGRALAAFKKSGAKAVISEYPPAWAESRGWTLLPGRQHALKLLP